MRKIVIRVRIISFIVTVPSGFVCFNFCFSDLISADVLSRATVELPMHFSGDHGDPSRGLFSCILGWTVALDLSGGTTGITLRMNEALVSTSTGNLPSVLLQLLLL